MDLHASKHAHDAVPATEEHIYQTVTNPDDARRSLDDAVGHETCIFTKHFAEEGHPMVVPVIYDGVQQPGDYDQGGKKGRVTTGYFETSGKFSQFIGEIFWTKPTDDEGKR
ncbi:MAG: hypothetical protein PW735_11180 [Acidobacteriaceae bacterium]|nr:hypothetical protein [Acidobacteriaceae bacterium]